MADEDRRGFASPPCMASDVAPDYFDPLAVDAQQARDVARWRRAQRTRLLQDRAALPVALRKEISARLEGHLERVLDSCGGPSGRVISAFWPIKSEPDLRALMARWHAQGAIVALPVVVRPQAALEFRRWTPGMGLVRGHWNIPVPPDDAPVVTPDICIAPLVGWALEEDGTCWRLGFGGGYFDRTLGALLPRPKAIGVGLDAARVPTIFPQPHDIPMDQIVTESGPVKDIAP
ncbi:5,10-methenyltetrahydrofolate synthetase [Albidovulum inexpectatum]|uniref:5-formyltetrahydrofolate cyclo-ligase n=1 Tax=Albidovulum inexpectatum TaxID=196587 RepID=A0A2S5JEP9_9RHOB|nr:5-formyltetrahydrofolate cyclo-ligase [Albidovulum inexpectatum]PPB79967.1 5,10-methenyltetrahydrofolate synthetase [Albidovulum inexpectatum]